MNNHKNFEVHCQETASNLLNDINTYFRIEPPKEKYDGQEINRQTGDFHFWFTVGLPKGDGFKIVELRFVIFRHRPDEIQYANESFLYEDDTVGLISKIEKINRLTS